MGQVKTIGFFGDSFCAREGMRHADDVGEFETYLRKLRRHYSAQIVNTGHGGSSVWDLVLNQLMPLIRSNTVPDVCVFVWSDAARLYHPEVRNISIGNAGEPHETHQPVMDAAHSYYKYLFNQEQKDLEYRSLLYYIDNVILTQLPSETRIIHLWSFGWPTETARAGHYSPNSIMYPHTWRNGVEIRPALVSFSDDHNDQWESRGPWVFINHMYGDEKNNMIANWIIEAVENYNGVLRDYSQHIVNLYWT